MTVAPTRTFTISGLNHVVLRVRDLERSEAFYRDVLGLKVRRSRPGRMTFFHIAENDHDLALFQVGPEAPLPDERGVGLYHFALELGSVDELKAAYHHFVASNANIAGITHHGHTKSIYLKDPDGIEMEIFCACEHDPNGTE